MKVVTGSIRFLLQAHQESLPDGVFGPDVEAFGSLLIPPVERVLW